MLRAYDISTLLQASPKSKSKFEAIYAHADKLFVGCSDGSLRVYSVDENEQHQSKKEPRLLKEIKGVAKSKFRQVACIKEAGVFLSLADGQISVYDLQTYDVQEKVYGTAGASVFAVTSNIETDTSGVSRIVSRLCVGIKRRLQFHTWQDAEFIMDQEITLPDRIRSLTWSTTTRVCVGMASDFCLVDAISLRVIDIDARGSNALFNGLQGVGMSYISMGAKSPRPLSTSLPHGEILLAKDDGAVLDRKQIPWTIAPAGIGFSYPYLIVLLPKHIEIRNPETQTLLQTFSLSDASLLFNARHPTLASPTQVWRLIPRKWEQQIDDLVDSKQFDEALSILNQLEDPLLQSKESKLQQVKSLKGHEQFNRREYEQAMILFSDSSTAPNAVLSNYPTSIASDNASKTADSFWGDDAVMQDNDQERTSITPTREKSLRKASSLFFSDDSMSIMSRDTHVSSKPDSRESNLKKAVRALATIYLPETRRKLQATIQANSKHPNGDSFGLVSPSSVQTLKSSFVNLNGQTLSSNETLEAQGVVDTALLRCYMLINPGLVGSLVRRPNYCDASVVQEVLEESGKLKELVDFFYFKGLHGRALELLQSEDNISSDLRGPEPTIRYLQRLNGDQIDLILAHTSWTLALAQDMTMEVFLADTAQSDSLPRGSVVDFLHQRDQLLAAQYLEHVIKDLKDLNPNFHNQLATIYIDVMKGNAEDSVTADKFLIFLRSSYQYRAEKILRLLPETKSSYYMEVRAVLYSRMGQHGKALELFVYDLNDCKMAEEYCVDQITKNSTPNSPSDKSKTQTSIFSLLLELYLKPPPEHEVLLDAALHLLSKYGSRFNASDTLSLLPEDVKIANLNGFFTSRMRHAASAIREEDIRSKLEAARFVQVEERLANAKQRSFVVTGLKMCPVCHKRLGQSVISIFPEGIAVHYGCAKKYRR